MSLLKYLAIQALEFTIIFIGFILGMLSFAVFIEPLVTDKFGLVLMVLCTTVGAWLGSETVEIVKKYCKYE